MSRRRRAPNCLTELAQKSESVKMNGIEGDAGGTAHRVVQDHHFFDLDEKIKFIGKE